MHTPMKGWKMGRKSSLIPNYRQRKAREGERGLKVSLGAEITIGCSP